MDYSDLSQLSAHEFLKHSTEDTYYKGEIYKEQQLSLAVVKSVAVKAVGSMEFISYKFKQNINENEYTFCITFRKKHTSFFNSGVDKYHIRLSLLFDDESECRGETAIMLSKDGILEHPRDNFTSVTTGQWKRLNAIVKDMQELPEDQATMFKPVVTIIQSQMDILGPMLITHCKEINDYRNHLTESSHPAAASAAASAASAAASAAVHEQDGGYTRKHNRLSRRRKSLLKRKSKKSYRKRKYGKSKKSRRIRNRR